MAINFSRRQYIFIDGNILLYLVQPNLKLAWYETPCVGAVHTSHQPGEGGGVGLVQSKKFYCAFLSKFQTLKKFRKICNITSKIWGVGWGGWIDAYFYFRDKIENLVWQITRLFRIFFLVKPSLIKDVLSQWIQAEAISHLKVSCFDPWNCLHSSQSWRCPERIHKIWRS